MGALCESQDVTSTPSPNDGNRARAGLQYESSVLGSLPHFQELKTKYNIEKTALGKNTFSKVYKGVDVSDSKSQVAIKMINKSQLSPEDFTHMSNEIKALKKVNFPSIGKYFETYEDERKLYQMMELGVGGELFDNRDACI